MQSDSSLVGGIERQRNQEYIGKSEDRFDFSVVTAEHSGTQNSMPFGALPALERNLNRRVESVNRKIHGCSRPSLSRRKIPVSGCSQHRGTPQVHRTDRRNSSAAA